jgi:hypothetical protein
MMSNANEVLTVAPVNGSHRPSPWGMLHSDYPEGSRQADERFRDPGIRPGSVAGGGAGGGAIVTIIMKDWPNWPKDKPLPNP